MIRSLYAGVSGLNNHQVKLDVIGNNIANVNTYGFKGARVTFAETLAQQESAPYAPHGRFGGINPMEVGLGVKVSSIDNDFSQGNLLSTGIATDLAIQGEGFFVVTDGMRRFYTRAGGFQIDSNGNLVAQGGQFFLQGKMADEDGNIASGTSIENVSLPFGQKEPAKASTSITYFCNLNADSDALQEIHTSDSGYSTFASINSSAAINNLTVSSGVNDTIQIGLDGDSPVTLTIDSGIYADAEALKDAINTAIGNSSLGGGITAFVDSESGLIRFRTVAIGEGHSLSISGGTMLADLGITAGATGNSTVTSSTLVNDLFLGDSETEMVTGDTIDITGSEPDGTPVSSLYTYSEGDTFGDLLAAINEAYAGATATIGSEGKIVLTDNFSGESSTVINLNASSGVNFLTPGFSTTLEGRDAGTHSTSINVYDSLGSAHTVEMIFTKAPEANTWNWETIIDGGLITPSSGSSGTVSFNNDGSLASFNGGPLIFTPPGGDAMSINLNPGNPGSFNGITQFDSPSTTIAISQDGYQMGNLENISIGPDGMISGSFSNGVVRTLGQLVLADFTNPTGLVKMGNNFFAESPNSGSAVIGLAQTNFNSSINAGYLEMSNVDLTREFTEMIVAQRGFQANARVIQTADMVLSEINTLKR
jgi:flagellar hook protein FlgE